MEFHRARTARMAGAAAPAMPKHRQAGATNQAGGSRATAGGLGPAARGVEGLGRSSGYGLRPSPGGSARPKAMKPHENLPDRLSVHDPTIAGGGDLDCPSFVLTLPCKIHSTRLPLPIQARLTLTGCR